MGMKRREVLKGGLLGAGMTMGLTEVFAKKPASQAGEDFPAETFDVVVVGAGMAGMCAALEAAEKGAKVVLLEKRGRPDGTTVYSSGWIAAVGSEMQKNHPEDTKEAFINDMMKLSHYKSDPELIKVYADEAGPGVNWLIKLGVPFKLWENLPAPELSRCVIAQGNGITGGSMLIRVLLKALTERKVPIRYNTNAVELIVTPDNEVEGVSCHTPEGRKNYLARGGVILTTGGYGANTAMTGAWIGPWAYNLVLRASPWNTGENITMGMQVRAKLVNLDQFYAGPITPTGHANPSPLMHAGYGIQVNTAGKRFLPEGWLQVPKAKGIANMTPDNRSFMLIGKDADNNDMILTNTLKRFANLGYKVPTGNTIAEVAKAAGVPPKALEETVAEFNKAVKAGKALELDPPYDFATPHALETGPFYMIPAAGGMATTMGGPKINVNANVVTWEDEPVPGLYAAGAAAGGVWCHDDIGGNQLGGCMVFGRIAARHAFARAKARG